MRASPGTDVRLSPSVNTPPRLDPEIVRAALRRHWGLGGFSLEYAKVGFGSHHWIARDADGGRHFVTVDDLTKPRFGSESGSMFASLERAFRAARALRDGGLEFVVAPLPSASGAVLHHASDEFSIAVFPFLDGDAGRYGEYESESRRQAVIDRVRRLHGSTELVEDVAGREDFVLPGRAALDQALCDLDVPWTGGPYAERARHLFRRRGGDVREALSLYDGLVADARSSAEPWVITHGEPHRGNVVWTADGPQLIDWDTALIAPPARDFWMLEPFRAGEDRALTLYRLWWELAEIGIYVAEFREPHAETEDMAQSWRNLEAYIELQTFHALRSGWPSPAPGDS